MGGIRRKLSVQGEAAQARAPEVRGAVGQWPLALARGAAEAAGLDLEAGPVQAGMAGLAEVLERLPEGGLIAVLEGPRGAQGVMVLSPGVLAALVERQTLGRVTPRPVVPRRPTRTDAAIAAGLIDATLAALRDAVEGEADRVWAAGFGYGSWIDDPRPLGLMLEDCAYRLLMVEVSLGAGAKSGAILLALPAAGRGDAPPPRAAGPDIAAAAMEFRAALTEQVMGAEVVLDAVIGRITLPLSEVMALTTDEVLRLGQAALDRIDLAGPGGLRQGGGRLGQTRGMRALRLDPGCAPAAHGPGSLVPGVATVEAAMRRTGT